MKGQAMKKMIPTSVAKVYAVMACLAAIAFALTVASAQPQEKNRKLFADSVKLLPEQGLTPHGLRVNAMGPERKSHKMDLLFSLSISKEDAAKLEARVEKGEVLTPEELEKLYSPKEADV